MPRLKSVIYVQALIRRCEVQGASAYLARRGAEEAGAVFIRLNRLDGTSTVLSPAQGSAVGLAEGRIWTKPLGDAAGDAACTEYFAKQTRYDPDIWIVEIEDREGRGFVDEPVL
jgi:hypothetical protein